MYMLQKVRPISCFFSFFRTLFKTMEIGDSLNCVSLKERMYRFLATSTFSQSTWWWLRALNATLLSVVCGVFHAYIITCSCKAMACTGFDDYTYTYIYIYITLRGLPIPSKRFVLISSISEAAGLGSNITARIISTGGDFLWLKLESWLKSWSKCCHV